MSDQAKACVPQSQAAMAFQRIFDEHAAAGEVFTALLRKAVDGDEQAQRDLVDAASRLVDLGRQLMGHSHGNQVVGACADERLEEDLAGSPLDLPDLRATPADGRMVDSTGAELTFEG